MAGVFKMLKDFNQISTDVHQVVGYADALLWPSKNSSNKKSKGRLTLCTPSFCCNEDYDLMLISDELAEVIHEVNCHLDYLDEQLEELEKSSYGINEQVTSETASDLAEIKYKLVCLNKQIKRLL